MSPRRSRQGPCVLHPALTARLCVAARRGCPQVGDTVTLLRAAAYPNGLSDQGTRTSPPRPCSTLPCSTPGSTTTAMPPRASTAVTPTAPSAPRRRRSRRRAARLSVPTSSARTPSLRPRPRSRQWASSASARPGAGARRCARPPAARAGRGCRWAAARVRAPARARRGTRRRAPRPRMPPGRRVRRRRRALGLEQRAAGRPRHAALGADEALVAGRSGDTPRPQAIERARDERRVAHGCGHPAIVAAPPVGSHILYPR